MIAEYTIPLTPQRSLMKKLLVVTALFALFSSAAYAQTSLWHDQNGKPIAETTAMKSQDGFAGMILLTANPDWKKEWQKPVGTSPKFQVADKITAGQTVTLLTFFMNPMADAAGNSNLRCDMSMTDPKGVTKVLQKDVVCFEGAISGPRGRLFLSRPTLDLSFDASDTLGVWTFDVHLRDVVRKVELPLRTTVEFK